MEPEWRCLPDLASAQVGGEVLFATDEWFAPAGMLLRPGPPEWREGVFTEQGKWMDGWETRRRREPGHDWCVIRLGLPGIVRGVSLDTAYFTGNYAPAVSLEGAQIADGEELFSGSGLPLPGAEAGGGCSAGQVREAARRCGAARWVSVVPRSPLRPGVAETRHNHFESVHAGVVTHLRLNYFPDGGVARLRVHGEAAPSPAPAPAAAADLAALGAGGMPLLWSNAHYGHPSNLLLPKPPRNMGEGWETARNPNRGPVLLEGAGGLVEFAGREWVVLKLGRRGSVGCVEVDTTHFKGNAPESVAVELSDLPELAQDPALAQRRRLDPEGVPWRALLPRTRVRPHAVQRFAVGPSAPATHARVTIIPDGGLARLRLLAAEAAAPRL